jgi:methanogenic corrinoid protein MtbC1
MRPPAPKPTRPQEIKMTDKDLTRAEVEALAVHRMLLRCMDDRDEAVIQSLAAEQRVATLEAENARLQRALQAATAYIEDLEEHEGAEGFSSSTGILGAAYRDAMKPAPTVTAGWPTEEGDGSIIVGNVKGDSHD